MGEMGSMMPLPDNTLPMMTGQGQFGPIEMGGMFTLMKVREGLAPGDYKDPGPYKNPPGTAAYEVDVAQAGEPARPPKAGESPGMNMPGMEMPGMDMPDMKHHH
jgi:manganese oxidase